MRFGHEKPTSTNGFLAGRRNKDCVLTILIADESREFREFVRRHLESERDFDVVGEVLSGNEFVCLVRRLRPDVVLVDIALSGMAGLEGARRIKAEMPSTGVIFLSVFDEEVLRDAAARYGADDFLSKEVPLSEMFSRIRHCAAKVAPGEYWRANARQG